MTRRIIRGIFVDHTGLRFVWEFLSLLGMVALILLGFVILADQGNKRYCATIAQESGKKTKYIEGECFVKVDGDYIPQENWKVDSEG